MSIVRPYGDTTGDGMVQLSFTLPIPHDKRAEGAAIQLAGKMGMDPAMLVHARQMGDGYTFFVVYGRVHHLVDLSKVSVVERDFHIDAPHTMHPGKVTFTIHNKGPDDHEFIVVRAGRRGLPLRNAALTAQRSSAESPADGG